MSPLEVEPSPLADAPGRGTSGDEQAACAVRELIDQSVAGFKRESVCLTSGAPHRPVSGPLAQPIEAPPPRRRHVLNNSAAILAQRDTIIKGVVLPNELVNQLMDYMTALTDDAARDLRRTIPERARVVYR